MLNKIIIIHLKINLRLLLSKYVGLYHLGIDSTDSPKGGCTTWTFVRVLHKLYQEDHTITFSGYPKLIRLNPNIPHRTRGNAALSVSFYSDLEQSNIFDIIKKLVLSDFELYSVDDGKSPGIVLLSDREFKTLETDLGSEFYNSTLQHIVKLGEPELSDLKTIYGDEGLVGAIGSIMADLSNDYTHELLAYRMKDNFNTTRKIDINNLIEIADQYNSTFSSYDPVSNRELICPSGPDPVFLGVRGDVPKDLISFFDKLEIEEKLDYWMIFISNQGTDQHVLRVQSQLKLNSVLSSLARVSKNPVEFRGGHIKLELQLNGNYTDCMVFEPTKKLREAARELIIGDLLYVHGAISSNEFGQYLSLEYMYLVNPVDKFKEIPPVCDNCNSSMTSAGRLSGYKCRTCSQRSYKFIPKKVDRKLYVGQKVYASHSAQRHLTRPLGRLNIRNKLINKKLLISDFTNIKNN